MSTYLCFINSASELPSLDSVSKSSTRLQWYHPNIISLFRQCKFRQWLWQWARLSIDTFRAASEEEATAHDLFASWGVGTGASLQTAAIFDQWRWGGPDAETRDHSQKSEGKIFSHYKRFSAKLTVLCRLPIPAIQVKPGGKPFIATITHAAPWSVQISSDKQRPGNFQPAAAYIDTSRIERGSFRYVKNKAAVFSVI